MLVSPARTPSSPGEYGRSSDAGDIDRSLVKTRSPGPGPHVVTRPPSGRALWGRCRLVGDAGLEQRTSGEHRLDGAVAVARLHVHSSYAFLHDGRGIAVLPGVEDGLAHAV